MGRYNNGSGLFTAAEFKNRGVIKLAPDALVYINSNLGSTVIAPVTKLSQQFDFQDGVSSISIQNNVEPPGSSSATVEITTPRYNEKSNYWVDYKDSSGNSYKYPILLPMMEIQIYFRGRFLVGDKPQYYPAFWGFILNVEESYSGGMWKINLQCADMLHWWDWLEVAFRPSVQSNYFTNGAQGLTVFGSRYEQANAFEIIYSLCESMGMESFITPSWLAKLTPSMVSNNTKWIDIYKDVTAFWNSRFKTTANLLRMYGARGALVNNPSGNPTTLAVPDPSTADKSKQATKNTPKFRFEKDDRFVKEFKVFHEFSSMSKPLSEADYMTRLQVATEVKNRVEYEFFQDVNGNFIFKPPFYNLNTKSLLSYRIKPQDIINFSSTLNTDEVVTVVEAQSGISQQIRQENYVNRVGYHVDMDLMKRFGFRYKQVFVWYLSESAITQSYSIGHMSVCNAKAHTATVNIPGRPELRLGYPIYMEHNDSFYYVKSINHTFDYGGSFTTNLSLEAERRKVFDTEGQVQESFVYKYSDKKNPPKTKKGTPKTNNKAIVKSASTTLPELKNSDTDDVNKMREWLRSAGLIKSAPSGFYDLVQSNDPTTMTITQFTAPFTDEEGYKVVGSFRYGRGIVLKAGTILDGATYEQTSNLTPSEIKTQRQSQDTMNIKIVSEEEGKFMGDYFKTNEPSNIPEGQRIETAIPRYLRFPDKQEGQKLDIATISQMLSSQTLSGASPTPPEQSLVASASTQPTA